MLQALKGIFLQHEKYLGTLLLTLLFSSNHSVSFSTARVMLGLIGDTSHLLLLFLHWPAL